MTKFLANKKKWGVGAVLILIILILLFLFIKHYQILGRTIEEERTTYVSEIKNQLVKNINAEKEQQITLVNLYGRVLSQLGPQHFEEIDNLLPHSGERMNNDEILLVDTNGNVYTVDGKLKSLSESQLLYELTVEKREVFGYSQINQGEEYWIYGAPVQVMQIDERKICAVINARSVSSFSERMSTGILDNTGFSYIMSKSGNVLVYPSAQNHMGYNIFRTLEGYGVNKNSIEKMKHDFEEGIEGKQILSYNENKWLLDYSGDLFDDWVVVVMMPMTITGADTYKILNGTAVTVLLLFLSILLFIVFISRNFYLREQMRERLIQQEKANLVIAQKIAESKNSFLAKMSHDIRTPLNAIIGLLQITKASVSGIPKAADNLSKAEKSAGYLLNVLNDILDMSKIESGKMEIRKTPFDFYNLLDTLETVNRVQTEAKQIEFEVKIEGTLSECYIGDKVRISQIMMNLLSNSIKFTQNSGHILFYVKATPKSDTTDQIIFMIKDNGIGMSEEYLSRLFQPFEQEEDGQNIDTAGSGLGLSIVKNLTELMSGSIDVKSEKGKGTCFTVTLSLDKAQKPQEGIEKAVEEDSLKGRKALLVEDNELNIMIAQEILVSIGHMSVETAFNGKEAVEMFCKSQEGEYDVIVMDIRMPVMNGLEATRIIRSLSRPDAARIPIVAMSANAFDEDIAAAYESGMNEYLSKPVDVQKVIAVLRKCCGKGRHQNNEK